MHFEQGWSTANNKLGENKYSLKDCPREFLGGKVFEVYMIGPSLPSQKYLLVKVDTMYTTSCCGNGGIHFKLFVTLSQIKIKHLT